MDKQQRDFTSEKGFQLFSKSHYIKFSIRYISIPRTYFHNLSITKVHALNEDPVLTNE